MKGQPQGRDSYGKGFTNTAAPEAPSQVGFPAGAGYPKAGAGEFYRSLGVGALLPGGFAQVANRPVAALRGATVTGR